MEALRGPNQKKWGPEGWSLDGRFFPSLGVYSVEFHAIHITADSDSGEEIDDDTVGIPSQMSKRPPARLICPTRSLFLLPLMSHVLPWQEDSGVWTKSLQTPSSGAGVA